MAEASVNLTVPPETNGLKRHLGTKGSIRFRLTLLILALAVPMIILGLAAVLFLADIAARGQRQQLQYSARATLIALDAHLTRHIAVARALVASPALLDDDLTAFRLEATRAFPDISDTWLIVSDPSGRQLMNLTTSDGKDLPMRNASAIANQTDSFQTNTRKISGVFQGAVNGQWIATVDFPVFKDGRPYRALSIILSARGIQRLFGDGLPKGWLAAIVDTKGNFFARTLEPESFVGRSASTGWRSVMGRPGIYEFQSIEGDDLIQATEVSALSGWEVGIAVKKNEIYAPVAMIFAWAAFIGLGVLALSLAVANAFASRIIRQLRELEANAVALVNGKPTRSDQFVPEIDGIWTALQAVVAARQSAETRQQMLIDELSHRVKNNLSIVQSIATQTLRHSASMPEFSTKFSMRLGLLAAAHDLLTKTSWEGASLFDLIEKVVGPFRRDAEDEAIRLHGAAVLISADQIVSLSLMLHELATNAVKYGALRDPAGRVSIGWVVDAMPTGKEVRIAWREMGVPLTTASTGKGFGTRLLALGAAQLGASIESELHETGLVWTCRFPVRLNDSS